MLAYKESYIRSQIFFFFLPFLPNPFFLLVKAFVIAVAQLDATSSA